jgi:hypothetical protein
MGELEEAIKRHDEKKIAAGIDRPANQSQNEDVTRAVLSGWDLDLREIVNLFPALVAHPIRAIQHVGLPNVLLGQWVDGLATGLTLADMRRRADAGKNEEEVVERMAIAMCETGQVEWEVQEDHRKDHFRRQARVALEAVRA